MTLRIGFEQAARTLELCGEPSIDAARLLLGRPWATYLGAGPNEATARFGAAKLFEIFCATSAAAA